MKKNIYTEAVSKISTPEDVLAKGLESIRNAEPTDEVINFKEAKSKRKWLKPIGAVAAALAVVIGISSAGTFSNKEYNILGGNNATGNTDTVKTSGGNPFIITANAEQLNTETYVKIGDVDLMSTSSGVGFHPDNPDDLRLFSMGVDFNFNVVCTGENIKSVTYSTSTGWFDVDKQLEGLVDYKPLSFDEQKKFFGTLSGNNRVVSSCEFDYDYQPKSSLSFKPKGDLLDGTIPLLISFNIHDAKEVYESNPQKYGADLREVNYRDLAAMLFNDSKYTYNAEVTANFTDGTITTQKLEFKCDHDENGYFLAAKIVE